MKLLKERGITLVALVVTIIILLILAGVTIGSILSDNGIIKRTRQAVEKYKNSAEEEKQQINQIEQYLTENKSKVDKDGKIKVNAPKVEDGMIPIKYDEEKKKWVITNEKDKEWYDYSEGVMKWANVMLSDGVYKANQKGTQYKDDGSVTVEDNELGSMFVWIPRYAYSFNSYHTENNNEGTTQKITNVEFIEGTGNKDFTGKSYGKSYSLNDVKVGSATPMIIHSGFTFGNEELSGIWIGKFEESMSGTSTNTVLLNDIETNNTASEKSIKVIPNARPWTLIGIGNCFFNCYNMNSTNNIYGINKETLDTHLIKNVEWGAVSYLSASQYGITPEINDYSDKDYLSVTGGLDYKTNTNQSTTNNATGIYDMCGGNWELVAAYYNNLDQVLKLYGKEAFTEERTLNGEYAKYWDKYEVGENEIKVTKVDEVWRNYDIYDGDGSAESNRKRIAASIERYNAMKNKLGDAMYEIINDFSYEGRTPTNTRVVLKKSEETGTKDNYASGYYNGDITFICDTLRAFVSRGGHRNRPIQSGVFASGDCYGGPDNGGFRAAIC